MVELIEGEYCLCFRMLNTNKVVYIFRCNLQIISVDKGLIGVDRGVRTAKGGGRRFERVNGRSQA